MSQDMSQQDLEAMINAMPNMIGYWDRQLYCRFANEAYRHWFDRPPTEILGMTFQELAGEQLFKLNEPHIHGVLAGSPQRFERTLSKADGSLGHIIGHYMPDKDDDGAVKGFFILANDVTELKQAEAELKLAACVFDNMSDGVFITNKQGHILSINPAFTAITGYQSDDVLDKSSQILQSNHHDRAFYSAIRREINNTGQWTGEIWSYRKDDSPYLARLTVRMVKDSDQSEARYVAIFNDITGSWHRNEQIKHLAFHDALTNLPNRTLLMERLDQKIINSEREKVPLAVMFIDLDGFKQVNDRFGHHAGDDVLKEIASRLLTQIRKSDTVARVGGDEFIFILNDPKDKADIVDIANRLITSINQPILLGDEQVHIGTSVGISLFPEEGITASELIRHADQAMYMAKRSGKNHIRFFTSDHIADADMQSHH